MWAAGTSSGPSKKERYGDVRRHRGVRSRKGQHYFQLMGMKWSSMSDPQMILVGFVPWLHA